MLSRWDKFMVDPTKSFCFHWRTEKDHNIVLGSSISSSKQKFSNISFSIYCYCCQSFDHTIMSESGTVFSEFYGEFQTYVKRVDIHESFDN